MAVETAAEMLSKAPKERQPKAAQEETEQPKPGGFEQVMRDLGNPKIVPASGTEEEDADAIAKRVAKAA